MSNRYLDIRPSNVPPTGEVSFKSGNPVITFNIGEDEMAELKGKTVKLSGKFHVTTDGSTAPTAGNSSLMMDSRIGVYSMIDQLVLSSFRTKQTIEHIRHYNRFMVTYLPVVSSEQDLIGHIGQSALTLPSNNVQQTSVVQQGAAEGGNEFCIFLPCGLLNGVQNFPLQQGLTIDIHLAPDSMVLFNQNRGVSNPNPNAQYKLTDLKLTCETHRPQGKELAQLQSNKTQGFEYQSISSYYSTINSTNAILNYSLGMSRVQSVFMNFIKSDKLNNLNQNSMMTQYPLKANDDEANINQIIFTRGGERYPQNFNVDTNFRINKAQKIVDPQAYRDFLNSVKTLTQLGRSLASPDNTFAVQIDSDADLLKNMDGGMIFGLGQSYTTTGDDGADFSRANWGMQLNVELTDNSPNSVFVFVHSKQTLLMNANGVQIMK